MAIDKAQLKTAQTQDKTPPPVQKTTPAKASTDDNSEVTSDAEGKVLQDVAETGAKNSIASFSGFLDTAEAQGNTGMVIDRTSFPVVVLDKSDFCNATTKLNFEMDGHDMHSAFGMRPMSWKERKVVTILAEGASQKDAQFYVMVDDETAHTGELIADLLAMATQEGAEVQHKTYVEYIGVAYAPEDTKGKTPLGLIICQVPPLSRGKPAGAIAVYQMNGTIVDDPTKVLFAIKVGQKIIRGDNTFYPWHFEVNHTFE